MTAWRRLDPRKEKGRLHVSHTTINQTSCSRLIYMCKDLHPRLHGSIDYMEITNNGISYEFVWITKTTLSLITTGPSCVAKDGDVTVACVNAVFLNASARPYFVMVTMTSPSLKNYYVHPS